jgi:cyclophilin family peptidyl-prolyl cis-trans isomerase
MNIILKTNKGNIKLELFDDLTPKTTENFLKLAKDSFYDGVKFHRVIKDFMIQSGDPLTKDDNKRSMWGTGGPGYSFEDEITPSNANSAYTISMANSGPHTNGSQFFINLKDNLFLNGKHTVFGKVIEGKDIVDSVGKVEVDYKDCPTNPIVIEGIDF